MKFGAFSDLHYDSIPDGDRRLRQLIDRFAREKVDFVVELGDLCHATEANKALLDCFADAKLPCFFSIGNHNTDHCPPETAHAFFGLNRGYHSVVHGNIKFIFLDANHVNTSQGIRPGSKENAGLEHAERPYVPPEQIEWLKREISDDEMFYVICSHHSLANEFAVGRHGRGVANRADVRGVLEARNAVSRRVLLCLNGHDHGGACRIIQGIPYYALNAASYIWHGMKPIYAYDEATHARYPYLQNMILYEEPPSIIVTIDEAMNLAIDGMETSYQRVTPADVGIGNTWNGVSILPRTESVRIRY